MIHFHKYHGLGNDYIVIDPAEGAELPAEDEIRRICHRNYGIGSDGILFGPLDDKTGAFGVRIFNPDGSEAEKSGNGLRIFARYLLDRRLVSDRPFVISTLGGDVTARVLENGQIISVEMGRVSFDSRIIPVKGEAREVLNEKLRIGEDELTFCAATIGNPHCVIIERELSLERVHRLGPLIENNPLFPNRTNVQFVRVIDRGNIAIEIWERGAGYTLASGSSSSAAAAVVHRLGLCDPEVTVHMPGGTLLIRIAPDYAITLTGPVTRVADGVLHPEMF